MDIAKWMVPLRACSRDQGQPLGPSVCPQLAGVSCLNEAALYVIMGYLDSPALEAMLECRAMMLRVVHRGWPVVRLVWGIQPRTMRRCGSCPAVGAQPLADIGAHIGSLPVMGWS